MYPVHSAFVRSFEDTLLVFHAVRANLFSSGRGGRGETADNQLERIRLPMQRWVPFRLEAGYLATLVGVIFVFRKKIMET